MPAPSSRDHRKRDLQLLHDSRNAADPKDVTGQTLRVDAHQRGRGMDVAHDERDGGFLAAFAAGVKMALKSENAEFAPASGEVGFRDLVDELRWSHILIITAARDACDACAAYQ